MIMMFGEGGNIVNTPFKKRENPLSLGGKTPSAPVISTVSNNDRVKYTATMEKELRIAAKIAATKKNLQFSQFIEEAVKEKLEREGY